MQVAKEMKVLSEKESCTNVIWFVEFLSTMAAGLYSFICHCKLFAAQNTCTCIRIDVLCVRGLYWKNNAGYLKIPISEHYMTVLDRTKKNDRIKEASLSLSD